MTKSLLTQYRSREGLSMQGFADLFHVDRRTVWRWEKGDPIAVRYLADIELVTGIPRQKLRPDIFADAKPPSPRLAGARKPNRASETTGGAA